MTKRELEFLMDKYNRLVDDMPNHNRRTRIGIGRRLQAIRRAICKAINGAS